jgi:hypothetical protein
MFGTSLSSLPQHSRVAVAAHGIYQNVSQNISDYLEILDLFFWTPRIVSTAQIQDNTHAQN